MLTEPEAWRCIAERIASGQWGRFGLCDEVSGLYFNDDITRHTKNAMERRLDTHLEASGVDQFGYFDEVGVGDTRVLAALWLALEAEDVAQL